MKLTVDGKGIEAREGQTVLQAALESEVYIPNLCYHPDLRSTGACRLCIVEIEGMRGYPTACTTAVAGGMVVKTRGEELDSLRRDLVALMISEAPDAVRADNQFKRVVEWTGTWDLFPGYTPRPRGEAPRESDPLIVRDPDLCVLCGRCVRICQEVRRVGAIGLVNRGIDTRVDTSYGQSAAEGACRFCGACVEVCPTGALRDKSDQESDETERRDRLVPCRSACPAGIDIPLYVRLISEGRYDDAVAVIREKAPFPLTLGCICIHPCEEACKRCDLNDPLAIRELKRLAAERDGGGWRDRLPVSPDTGRRAAVVGAGPAGLTAAWFLRLKGHEVTVYDSLPRPGGTMWSCIPRYRLTEETLRREIEEIENLGVKIKTRTPVQDLDDLFAQGNEAVLLALGAVQGMKMGIPGEEDPRVLDGVTLLQSINGGEEVDAGGVTVVVGGGNVAIDVVRSMIRLGSEDVRLLYRRTRREMPAEEEELNYAEEEGVRFELLVNPVEIIPAENGLVIRCVRMELGEPDDSGRRRPVPVEGSEFEIEADRVIMAIGQRPVVPEGMGVDTDRRGRIRVNDETLATSRDGVFAAGDSVSGAASVIEGIAMGRRAAEGVDRYLGGDGLLGGSLYERRPEDPRLGREAGFAERRREPTPVMPLPERLGSFAEVERCFADDDARCEAARCLRCHLRLAINAPPEPPSAKT